MKILINYADQKYNPSRKWNTLTGKHIARFDTIHEFGPEHIEADFAEKHKEILAYKRGNGLWLWKPYFVKKVIDECKDGDLLFYCDAGSFFVKNIQAVEQLLSEENPLFVCDIPLLESCFTKPECFIAMNCEEERYKRSNQIIATFFALHVCRKSREFIAEWLEYCCNIELISPVGSIVNRITRVGDGFVSHREDQSIFSLLCKRYGFEPHKDISQRGNNPQSYYSPFYTYRVPVHRQDTYKPMVYLHKSPKVNLWLFLKIYLKKMQFILTKRGKCPPSAR